MIYRDSTAYDFDLFTDNKKREVVEIPVAKPAPKKAARTQPAARTFKQRAVAVCAVAAVLLLVVAQLHCQLVNSETVDQIGRAQKKIETLESEQTRLQVELEEKISFTNMETTAKQLGMQKMSAAQTQYVNLHRQDESEVLSGQGGLTAQIWDLF